MPKASPIQSNFNKGEISPLMYGRVDFEPLKSALAICLNSVPLIQGPVTRRPGTMYVGPVKTQSAKTRLVRFEFSNVQAYVLEFGNNYIRVYMNHAQVLTGGLPVEITTTYTTAEIFDLVFTQSADTLYIAHQNHAPAKLTRSSHTSWTLSAISFTDGPYMDANGTSTTMTASACTGSVTVTASAVTGINSNTGFQTTDVGRAIRIRAVKSDWGWGVITARASTTSITVQLSHDLGTTVASDRTVTTNITNGEAATDDWALGLWSDTTGYPGVVAFHEDRLIWAASKSATQTVNASVTGSYEDQSPTEWDGSVIASDALNFTLNSGDVQIIKWMLTDERGLLIGTQTGEWIVKASDSTQALSATNISAKQSTRHGSKGSIPVIRSNKVALFVQRAGRKVRELAYVFTIDGFQAPDMTVLNEHVTKGGIVDAAYQQEPHSVVWCPRTDGILLGMTYEREQNVIGWHRHSIGGFSDSGKTTQPIVESVVTIPEPNGNYDEVWMICQRYINGAVTRYIEVMTKYWERGDDQTGAWFVDCGLQYSGAPSTTISGLSHLEGETVDVLADGASHPQCVVSSGAITLNRASSVVTVGYGYNSDGQMLRDNAGAGDGTALGKTQRTHRIAFLLHDTLGLEVGKDFNNLEPIIFRNVDDDAGTDTPLFSGIKTFPWEGDYTTDNYVCWRFYQPFPGTIEAVMPQLETQDR